MAEINEIKSKITRLDAQLESATGVREHDINQRILELEKTPLKLYKHKDESFPALKFFVKAIEQLYKHVLQQNARSGNF